MTSPQIPSFRQYQSLPFLNSLAQGASLKDSIVYNVFNDLQYFDLVILMLSPVQERPIYIHIFRGSTPRQVFQALESYQNIFLKGYEIQRVEASDTPEDSFDQPQSL